MTGEKPWDTTNEIVKWLESPAGEYWSQNRHAPIVFLVSVKSELEDHESYLWYR